MKNIVWILLLIGVLSLFQIVLWRGASRDLLESTAVALNDFGVAPPRNDYSDQSNQRNQINQAPERQDISSFTAATPDDITRPSTTTTNDEKKKNNDVCGLWLAKSSIPGAGLGMFAGRDFENDEDILDGGDLALPVIDIDYQNRVFQPKFDSDHDFLWIDYVWNAEALEVEHLAKDVTVASTGFGAVPNCVLDLVNVKEGEPQYDEMGLQLGVDPGAGAFSPYHGRPAKADAPKQTKGLLAGDELFVDYDDHWFETRQRYIGYLPLKGDYRRADKLVARFRKAFGAVDFGYQTERRLEFLKDAFDRFLPAPKDIPQRSTVLAALPKTWEEFDRHLRQQDDRLFDYHHSKHSVSMEWLEEHGACADHIRVAPSTIPQAGRGAFAKRSLPEGSLVSPAPVIHLPNRSVFAVCDFDYRGKRNGSRRRMIRKILGNPSSNYTTDDCPQQLLLNYCMGHRESTLLLCPYGVQTAYVNHGSGREANVKWQWASTSRSTHQPEWLNLSVAELREKEVARMALELIATRDIQEGEEILVDYGSEWEQAWDRHVRAYPRERKQELQLYKSAQQLNQDLEGALLKAAAAAEHGNSSAFPPPNVGLCVSNLYLRKWVWEDSFLNGTLREEMEDRHRSWRFCNLVVQSSDVDPRNNRTVFTLVRESKKTEKPKGANDDDDDGERRRRRRRRLASTQQPREGKAVATRGRLPALGFTGIPPELLQFADKPYTMTMVHTSGFRHDLRIPDELFPDAWKNRRA